MTAREQAVARVREVAEVSREAARLRVRLQCDPQTAAIQADALDYVAAVADAAREYAEARCLMLGVGRAGHADNGDRLIAAFYLGECAERLMDAAYEGLTRTGGASHGN